jgi:hypothetical protein
MTLEARRVFFVFVARSVAVLSLFLVWLLFAVKITGLRENAGNSYWPMRKLRVCARIDLALVSRAAVGVHIIVRVRSSGSRNYRRCETASGYSGVGRVSALDRSIIFN